MGDAGFWSHFIIGTLAAWRITHLLSAEDGPADVIVRVRVRLGAGIVGRLLDCFYCLSLWVAAPIALMVCRTPVERLVTITAGQRDPHVWPGDLLLHGDE